jgi:hypothetical protein
MRALADPDAYLPTDIGVRHGLRAAGAPETPGAFATDAWRPWRSYAVHHLWVAAADAQREAPGRARPRTPAETASTTPTSTTFQPAVTAASPATAGTKQTKASI